MQKIYFIILVLFFIAFVRLFPISATRVEISIITEYFFINIEQLVIMHKNFG